MPQQRNKQKNKNKKSLQKPQKKQKGSKSAKTNPFDPSNLLTGKDLRKMVKSQVRMEVRPQVKAAQREAKELQSILDKQVGRETQRGAQATSQVGSYYKQLAEQEAGGIAMSQALGTRLTGEVNAAKGQAQAGLNSAADASLARLDQDDALRGQQPSSARDELQAMIVAQQGRMGTEGAALSGAAASNSSDWTNALQMMKGAHQMRATDTMGDINAAITNRIGDLRSDIMPGIRDAKSAAKDARASKGSLSRQILNELRGTEREYGLSKAALGIDKKSLKADAAGADANLKVAKQYGKNALREKKATLKSQLKVIAAQSGAKAREQARTLNQQLKVIEAQIKAKDLEQAGSKDLINAQGSGNKGKLSEFDQTDRQRALSLVRSWKSKNNLNAVMYNKKQLVDELNASKGVNPVLGRWAIKQYIKGEEKKRKKSLWNN